MPGSCLEPAREARLFADDLDLRLAAAVLHLAIARHTHVTGPRLQAGDLSA
jgi:hypothetical protein